MTQPVRAHGAQSDASDGDVVIAARWAGNATAASDAFGILVARYQHMVYALALSLVREPADAADVAQDAFLRAFRNLDLLADPTKFAIWLRRITFGVCIDHVRAEQARRRRSWAAGDVSQRAANPDGNDAANSGDDALFTDTTPSPLRLLERAELASRVLAELERLPARYRVPFTLFHIDGLSHAKVAESLGVPEGTVRSLVARARRKLAGLLANTPEVQDMVAEAGMQGALDVLDDSAAPSPRLMHVLNGDAVRTKLERSDVPGAFAPYADILHEGPVPVASGTAAWRETRARYIAASGYASFADALRKYEHWDEQLSRYGDYDEVVFWFEHDLFDQLLLVRHLDWFSRRALGRTTLSLICVGEFPGYARFDGLGQLSADQLASLLGTRERVSVEQIELGRRTWHAFTADDPTALDAITRSEADVRQALPFLPGALRRFLEEYPAVGNGLPRTERHVLECLSDGPSTTEQLFRAEQLREERVFMGDSTFWARVGALASGPAPLVVVDVESRDGAGIPPGTARLTDIGREVLAGRADWVTLNGFDRWLGGVHLHAPLGGEVAWRYDARAGRLVRGIRGQST